MNLSCKALIELEMTMIQITGPCRSFRDGPNRHSSVTFWDHEDIRFVEFTAAVGLRVFICTHQRRVENNSDPTDVSNK